MWKMTKSYDHPKVETKPVSVYLRAAIRAHMFDQEFGVTLTYLSMFVYKMCVCAGDVSDWLVGG